MKRIEWLDRARGYALLLVVLGHMGIPIFGRYITSFHMPLFFLISGITFNASVEFEYFVKKRAKRLLIPYFCLGIPLVVSSFATRITDNVTDYKEYFSVIYKFVIQKRTYTIWFLTTLFILNISFYLCIKITKNNLNILGLISFVSAGLSLIYYNMGGEALVWNIDVCLTAMPFFYMGYYIKEKCILDKDVCTSWLMFVISAGINIICVTINWLCFQENFNMALNQYGNPIISFIAICSGIYCVCFFSKKIEWRWVEYLGKNTLIYFAWHQSIALPIILYILSYIPFFSMDTIITDAIRTFVVVILIFVVLYPFDRLTHHPKMRFLVGKS